MDSKYFLTVRNLGERLCYNLSIKENFSNKSQNTKPERKHLTLVILRQRHQVKWQIVTELKSYPTDETVGSYYP